MTDEEALRYRPGALETQKWLTIGSDPEFPILRNGRVVPASEVGLGGPAEKKNLPNAGSYFRDGWNLEINPNPVGVDDLHAHYVSARALLEKIQKDLPNGCSIGSRPSYRIRMTDLLKAPPDAVEFGCHPTKNAYQKGVIKPDLDGWTHLLRYAGAHLHFGVKAGGEKEAPVLSDPRCYPQLVKFLDYYVGAPLAFVFKRPEQFLRRCHYGRAGEYREQVYPDGGKGLEYRVLGPEVFNHPAYFSLAVQAARVVIGWNWKEVEKWFPTSREEELKNAINTGKGLDEFILKTARPSILGIYTPESLVQLKQKRGKELFRPSFSAGVASWQSWATQWGITLTKDIEGR